MEDIALLIVSVIKNTSEIFVSVSVHNERRLPKFLELLSNPFDSYDNKICSIHKIRWFFPSLVDSFNSSIRFAIETDNTK